MRILVITPGFLPTIGGAEIGVHEVYTRLSARHEVTILTQAAESDPQSAAGFDMTRYTIRRYQDWGNLGRLPGRMLLRGIVPPFSIGATLASIRTIRQLHPDVINVHYAIYTGLAALWAQLSFHVPTVLSLIGRDAAPGPQVPALWPWYAGKIARRLSHTIFISEYCRKHYPAALAGTIVPYGVDTSHIRPSSPDPALIQRLGLPSGIHILFSLQRLVSIKRVHLQLEIARSLLDSGVHNILLLIGGSGPERRQLEIQSHHLNLDDHVRFLGFLPENNLPEYFSLADIFLMTSAYETFGITLAQALSAGLPVVAMSNTAIPEIIEHEKCGLLSPDADPELMAGNIRTLLENPQMHQRMRLAARQRAEEFYDWQQIAARYEEILEKACR